MVAGTKSKKHKGNNCEFCCILITLPSDTDGSLINMRLFVTHSAKNRMPNKGMFPQIRIRIQCLR